jgi:tetratricopeptide (TPR) repeat protein
MSNGAMVLKRLYVVFSDPSGRGAYPQEILARILPHLDHMADLYLISEDLLADWGSVAQVLEQSRAFLERWRFCRLNLRPVHPVGVGGKRQFEDLYEALSQWGDPFHREALHHQVVSRWMVLPVLRARSDEEAQEAGALAPFLRKRMMTPVLCLPPMPSLLAWADRPASEWERILLEERDGALETLTLNGLFDDLQGWALSSAGGFSLEACPGLVVDTVREILRRCTSQETRPYAELDSLLWEGCTGTCLSCWNDLPGRMRGTLRWNHREEEGDRVQYQLGVFALSRGDIQTAEGHLQAVATGSSSPGLRAESLLYLGILHFQAGRVEEAHGSLSQALALMPDSSSAMYHLGRCEFAWRDYIAASDLFRKAVEMGVPPELDRDLRLHWGISHIQLGEFQEALAALDPVTEASAPIHFYRGMAVLGLERLQEALQSFEAALAAGPEGEDVSSIHFYLGHCLKEMGRWEEALPHLQWALEADPGNYEAWNLLGYCRFRMGRHHEAIQALLKAVEINPGSAIDHASIGSNLRELGDLEGAATWYRRALALDPTIGFAAENLRKLEQGRDQGSDVRGQRAKG